MLAFVREKSVMMVDGQPAAATATIENVSAEGDAAPGSAPSPRRSSRAASAKKEEKTKETEAVPTAAEAEEETKDGEKGEDAEVEAVSKVKYKEDRSVFKPERVFVPPAMSRSGRAVKMSARAQEAKQHADEAEAKAQAPAPSPRSKSKPTRLEDDEEDEEDEGEEGEEGEEGKKRKKARRSGSVASAGAAEVDSPAPDPQPVEMKRKWVTTTLSRLEGSFGFALDGNYVSAVHEGGAAALNGNIKVGDWIKEVNGKDTAISGFAPLLPKSREAPIRLKLARLVTLEEASMEAEEKAMAKLAEATDAPDLPEGATSSATEARRRLFASAVSAATKAGLDKEAIKVVQVKLARLPPPPPKPEVTYRDPFELPPMPAPGT